MTGLDEQKDERIHLLVIVIWFGGTLSLLFPNDIGPDDGWSVAALRLYAAIAGMFLSGCFAFASVTEHNFAQSIAEIGKVSIVVLVVGGMAAISVGNGSAAFLMLILTGFSLNWWGTARH